MDGVEGMEGCGCGMRVRGCCARRLSRLRAVYGAVYGESRLVSGAVTGASCARGAERSVEVQGGCGGQVQEGLAAC
eukprot:3713623-Rhodomonas_salina.1